MNSKAQELTVYLPELVSEIRNMNDGLYKGQVNEALTRLNDIIGGIEKVLIDYSSMWNCSGKILIINNMFSRINSVIIGKDFIQLADIFEYEIICILEEILDELKIKTDN